MILQIQQIDGMFFLLLRPWSTARGGGQEGRELGRRDEEMMEVRHVVNYSSTRNNCHLPCCSPAVFLPFPQLQLQRKPSLPSTMATSVKPELLRIHNPPSHHFHIPGSPDGIYACVYMCVQLCGSQMTKEKMWQQGSKSG